MAHIEKRGSNYLIRVSVGYDSKGKKITRSTTYKPGKWQITEHTSAGKKTEMSIMYQRIQNQDVSLNSSNSFTS